MTNTCTDCIYEPLPDIVEPCHSCELYSRWTPKTEVEPVAEAEPTALTRESVLDAAKKIVCNGRNAMYGEPEDSFDTIAGFWSGYLAASIGHPIGLDSTDVAAMMALLKIARIATDSGNADSWVDLAGYAACGGECAQIPVDG